MSGFIGAQYELLLGSLAEHSGNSGLKDILINGEGAAFGTGALAHPNLSLPGKFDGPPVEDRSIPGADRKHLPSGAQAIVDESADTSKIGIAKSVVQGFMGRKIDNDVRTLKETGIPPAPSPQEH